MHSNMQSDLIQDSFASSDPNKQCSVVLLVPENAVTEILDEEDLLETNYHQAFEDRGVIQPYRIDLPVDISGYKGKCLIQKYLI